MTSPSLIQVSPGSGIPVASHSSDVGEPSFTATLDISWEPAISGGTEKKRVKTS